MYMNNKKNGLRFISLELFYDLFTSYEMELGFYDLFTSYEMELESHVHVQIKKPTRVS